MKPKKNYPAEVYLNGKWLKHDQAFVSVFDRGFMFGDGIYEVTPFYNGIPFKLKEHLERLQYCLNEVQIEFDVTSLEKIMLEAVSRAGLSKSDAAVYIQISRGTAPRTHFFPENPTPVILLYSFPVNLEKFETKRWKLLVSEDKRWHRCDIKTTALMASIMANDEAISLDFEENLLVRKGYFTEASHSSAFFVKYKTVYTHPEGPNILSGITRKQIILLCKNSGIKVKEKAVHLDELVEVDEIFLTGTTTQVVRVESVHSREKELFRARKSDITTFLQNEFIKLTRA
ncbi:aminotransferase class IV [Gillisia limnaea]|uniref:Aminotransferase class IV n=1 Tax=Gillisia limnaea (strain DSM 15749 / LMG 21470 / R-8282) TaxID=865937 RepID=H2BU20_GILLR|nr:aminotransferase class IV [Gillisia limnaea]EHQ01616.1 aminotransferase class IV [Gillisia limnaea DSM 15749]